MDQRVDRIVATGTTLLQALQGDEIQVTFQQGLNLRESIPDGLRVALSPDHFERGRLVKDEPAPPP